MWDKIITILSDSGEISAMRVMSFLGLIVGSFIGIAGLYMDRDLSALAVLCSIFVGSSLGGKAIQKFAERKQIVRVNPNNIDNPDA